MSTLDSLQGYGVESQLHLAPKATGIWAGMVTDLLWLDVAEDRGADTPISRVWGRGGIPRFDFFDLLRPWFQEWSYPENWGILTVLTGIRVYQAGFQGM